MKYNITSDDYFPVLKNLLLGQEKADPECWSMVGETKYFERPNSIFLKINKEPFLNWFVYIESLNFTDEGLDFSYSVVKVPQNVSDKQLEDTRPDLNQFVQEMVVHMLESTFSDAAVAATEKEINEENNQ